MVGSELVKRYLKDLDTQENDLIATRENISRLETEDSQLDTILKQLKMEIVSDARKERDSLSMLFL